jgi:predicted DNA binding protein
MREALLNLDIPGNWMGEMARKYDAEIHMLSAVPAGKLKIRGLLEILAKEEDLDGIINDIENNPNIKEKEIKAIDMGKLLAAVTLENYLDPSIMVDANCFILSNKIMKNGKTEMRLIVTSGEHLQEIMTKLKGIGCTVALKKISSISIHRFLTEREETILHVAYQKGYFDYPKKVGIRELADVFKISPSTLSESLRRGQRKILQRYMEVYKDSYKLPFVTI